MQSFVARKLVLNPDECFTNIAGQLKKHSYPNDAVNNGVQQH